MSAPILRLEGLSGGYGAIDVLRDVDLAIHPGEIVALLGANGAGKSTLLNAIVGFLPRMTGVVELEGRPIMGLASERLVKLGLALVPERRQLFGAMTVEENLMLGAYSSPQNLRHKVEAQYARFPILGERRRQLAQTMSGGQQQMLAIARGLIASPRVLLLDEPSLGLAPLIVAQVFAEIRSIREAGGTVLVVEQNAAAALRIADRAYVMKTGRIVEDRTAAEFLADDTIAQTYLGGGAGSETMEVRLRAKARRLRVESTLEEYK